MHHKAGICPGNYESAGKKTSKITHGNKALRTIAVECALAARQQNNRISAHRNRIMKRQGKKKAHIASAHLIIVIAYNILKTGEPYQELGSDYVHNSEL
ncbi:transposase [Anaerobacillus sp. HL2]|nr:transposase [Anaerobacillus sp. HL2]